MTRPRLPKRAYAKVRRAEHTLPRCALCSAVVIEDFFCHGCQHYVCSACDPGDNSPTGRHQVEEHRPEGHESRVAGHESRAAGGAA